MFSVKLSKYQIQEPGILCLCGQAYVRNVYFIPTLFPIILATIIGFSCCYYGPCYYS